MSRIGRAVVIALALLLCLAAGSVWYLRSAEADPSRGSTLDGLSAAVEVWQDSLGVPHLWAESEADLLRALGFVHARDRLFQMELFRRVADGRLAEVLGADLLETDRFLRTLGLGRAAAANEPLLDPESRALLEAYVAGVNAWIDARGGALPPEFLVLRFRPEPWTVRNSLSIGKIMAWDLTDWEGPLELQRAVDRVGPELAALLRPGYPDWGPHILGPDASWNSARAGELPCSTIRQARAGAASFALDARVAAPTSGVPLPRIPNAARELLDAASISRASNSWVIGGSRTGSGMPILANDMHLALRAPSLWYLAALHGGGIDVAGMTIPGTPVVVAGHSHHIAWGFTNASVADADFFVEQVDSMDPTRYRAPDGVRPFEVRAETIRVKGREPVVHWVRSTRNGPVVSDVDGRAGARVLALRWTAHEPSTEFSALLAMNRARSAAEFLTALRSFNNPHQNVVFAAADGTYGYRLTGRIPVRRRGDGSLPVPGWTGDFDWIRFLEPDEHPQVVRARAAATRHAPEDFIVTANNRQLGAEYPFQIAATWAEPFRAQRIRELIESGAGFTADDVARQQMDLEDAFAARYLPHAIGAAEAAGEAGAAEALRAWDTAASHDSRAAALFYTWYEMLRRRIGEDEYRGERMYFPRAALNAILDRGGGPWVDDVRTPNVETLEEQAAAAMRHAVREVGDRTWGELHQTHIDHALGRVRALDRMLGFNIPPFAKGGSPYTVDVAGYGNRAPFVNTHGASQRHVVDMADPDGTGGFVIPTGQSGLPFSRHYRDQTPLWREGRLWRIPLDRSLAATRTVHRMVLRPRDGG